MEELGPALVPNVHRFYLFRNTAVDSKKTTPSLEMRNQTKLLMQPFANWEEYLTPAPLSIAILGELVFISSKEDFSINKNPPKNGFQHIRDPDSFQACFMQVCKSGRLALSEAQKNMDQIWLHTTNVPDHMKTAVKILFNPYDEVSREQLPDQLKRIRLTVDNCLELAESTEKLFTDVPDIIQELHEACVVTKNFYEEELDKSRRKQEKKQENDIKTTIQMLVKGMNAMVRVKEQWQRMVRFFQMVSIIVRISLTRTLTDFVSKSEKIQTLSYNTKLFCKDLLYNQAFQASNIANLVHMILATYTEVSEKYLMDNFSSLEKLMAMDKEKPEFEKERLQLQSSCDEAQKGILRLVLKNKQEFESKSDSRLEKIDNELLAILLKSAPEEMKSIQAAVQSGFTEKEEEEEAGYYCF
ncbi:uncharacterized protein [Salminus brasiliensis]|uniref:uncharacterized protein n=1 Tax=Salminus brasiliensis TaxID=930266 RepID=UPI003B82D0B9